MKAWHSDIVDIREWLLRITAPVVIFIWSRWRNINGCEAMRVIVEALSKDEKYSRAVAFFYLQPDDNVLVFQELGVGDTPCVIVFSGGKEKARFYNASSKSGISHQLNLLLDPAKHHPSKPSAPSTKGGNTTLLGAIF